jgi:hypothetical protein
MSSLPTAFIQVPLRPDQLERGLPSLSNEEVPGVPVTMVSADPAELEKRWGLHFDDTFDNLDYVKVAVVQTRSGARLTLLVHRGNPVPGVELCAVDASSASIQAAHLLARSLNVAPIWSVSPYAH